MTSTDVRPIDDSAARLDRLAATAAELLQRCRARGASQAEVSCSEEHGLSVDVRMGDVETVESTRDRGIGVTVYFGKRKGSAAAAWRRCRPAGPGARRCRRWVGRLWKSWLILG